MMLEDDKYSDVALAGFLVLVILTMALTYVVSEYWASDLE